MSSEEDNIFSDNESYVSDTSSDVTNESSEIPFFLKTPLANERRKVAEHINDIGADNYSKIDNELKCDKVFDVLSNDTFGLFNKLQLDKDSQDQFIEKSNIAEQLIHQEPIISDSEFNTEGKAIIDSKYDRTKIFSSDEDSESSGESDSETNSESEANSDDKQVDGNKVPDNLFECTTKENTESFINEMKSLNSDGKIKLNFIHSLLDCVDNKYRDEEAHRHRINYKYWKVSLARKIFNIFNENVFYNKLPADTEIRFNKRYLTKGGTCHHSGATGKCVLNISDKICTDAERLLTIMIHEMCHEAVFLINKDMKDAHGPLWKAWCVAAKYAFPLVPLSSRCHSYKAKTKYEYRCNSCNFVLKRHSKLKTKMKCKFCLEELVLFSDGGYGVHLKVDPSKPLTGFAKYVQENYKKVRNEKNNHKETMKTLSRNYQIANTTELADQLRVQLGL